MNMREMLQGLNLVEGESHELQRESPLSYAVMVAFDHGDGTAHFVTLDRVVADRDAQFVYLVTEKTGPAAPHGPSEGEHVVAYQGDDGRLLLTIPWGLASGRIPPPIVAFRDTNAGGAEMLFSYAGTVDKADEPQRAHAVGKICASMLVIGHDFYECERKRKHKGRCKARVYGEDWDGKYGAVIRWRRP